MSTTPSPPRPSMPSVDTHSCHHRPYTLAKTSPGHRAIVGSQGGKGFYESGTLYHLFFSPTIDVKCGLTLLYPLSSNQRKLCPDCRASLVTLLAGTPSQSAASIPTANLRWERKVHNGADLCGSARCQVRTYILLPPFLESSPP